MAYIRIGTVIVDKDQIESIVQTDSAECEVSLKSGNTVRVDVSLADFKTSYLNAVVELV